jgi:hypothetical protein
MALTDAYLPFGWQSVRGKGLQGGGFKGGGLAIGYEAGREVQVGACFYMVGLRVWGGSVVCGRGEGGDFRGGLVVFFGDGV